MGGDAELLAVNGADPDVIKDITERSAVIYNMMHTKRYSEAIDVILDQILCIMTIPGLDETSAPVLKLAINLVVCMIKLGNHEEAMEILNTTLIRSFDLSPLNQSLTMMLTVHNIRACYLIQQERLEEAKEDIDSAVEILHGLPFHKRHVLSTYNNMIDYLLKRNRYSDAITTTQHMIDVLTTRVPPEDPAILQVYKMKDNIVEKYITYHSNSV